MHIQPASTDAVRNPTAFSYQLPPQILERAAEGVSWVTLISAVSTVALTLINRVLQPEVAAAWTHPVLRATMIGVLLLSVSLITVQRQGWLTKTRLLDLGLVFQVAVAFACGLLEAATFKDPNSVVLGHSAGCSVVDTLRLPHAQRATEIGACRGVMCTDVAARVLGGSGHLRLSGDACSTHCGLVAAIHHHGDLDVGIE